MRNSTKIEQGDKNSFLSTNKVYGDSPIVDLHEGETRYDLHVSDKHFNGIKEDFGIDMTKHSLFGCSKAAADLYVQEYARYFGLKTIVLRGGCLTGGMHRGAKLHGFLNYLVRCGIENIKYEIIGYKGKQVRDNLHAKDIGILCMKILKLNGMKMISKTMFIT